MVLKKDWDELPETLRRDLQQYQQILSLDPYETRGIPSHDLTGKLRNYRALEIDYNRS